MLANHTKCLVKNQMLKASDLHRIIKKLSPTKAPGPDQITAQMIQELPPSGLNTLLQLYNAMLRLEYWPTKFKLARVIMIPNLGSSPLKSPHTGPSAYYLSSKKYLKNSYYTDY
jgi:hypothetical protein